MKTTRLGRFVLLATSMLAAPALAEESGNSNAGNNGIQEIVVTAQREAQNVLSVPLSIQAITGDALNNEGVRDLMQLQFTTPGFTPIASTGYELFFIRGIGNSLFVGADPSVTTYIDDVPRIWGSLIPNMFDVERIEVLKGAQGGLYGRNATGGVINVITNQPSTDKYEGSALFDYGEHNDLRAAGMVNIPISDKVAFEAAAERDSHDPFVKNVATNPDPYTAAMFPNGGLFGLLSPQQTANLLNSGVVRLPGYGSESVWSAEGKLLLKASDNFKITIMGDYSNKADTNGNQDVNTTPGYTEALFTQYLSEFGINAKLPANFFVNTAGKYTSVISDSQYQKITDYGTSVTAVLSQPDFDITSITAYRAQRPRGIIDIDSLSVPFIESDDRHYLWYFYQELRAISTSDGPWHWLGGATYLRDHFSEDGNIDLFPPLDIGAPTDEATVIRNWSVYAQGGYDLTHALNLTISGRYIHETNDTEFSAPVASGVDTTEQKFLPSATLSYKFEDGGNAYARYARGWKAGGVNPVAAPTFFEQASGNLEGSVFGPETVDTYEIGYRAPLLEDKMQLTTAAFYNHYTGLQVSVYAEPQYPQLIYNIVNAGSARTWGGEETLQWRVISPLTLGVSAGYLNAKYLNFELTNSTVLVPFNRSGTTMLNSPTFQLTLSANVDQPITDKLDLVGNILESHTSSILYCASGLPGVLPNAVQPAYWLTNMRIGVQTSDGKYGFAVFANNLFNKYYYTYGSSSAASGNIFTVGDPRVVGGEITAKF